MERRYRRNVAAVIVDGKGRLLACERSDVTGAWQFPQGGIDDGETAEEALLRELWEEIGTAEVEIIWKLPDPIRYDWPAENRRAPWHGQEQTYFLVRLKPEAKIDLTLHHQEFSKTEWVTPDEFISRLSGFKREPYVEALKRMHERFPELIQV